MEHQIHGQVFIDGEWRSRPADVYQIMARARQQQDLEQQQPESKLPNEVPQLGILSRTLFPSPLVKFILPINIRHKNQNDVVFVGEDSVHLKEVCAYGHLRHVASKSDFKGHILAAKVLGERQRAAVHAQDRTSSEKKITQSRRTPPTSSEMDVLPAEIILLTLTSRTLMFLWVEATSIKHVRFRYRSIRLPSGPTRYSQLGPHIAVDPKCRAIAVGAYEGRFILYKTSSIEKWREDFHNGHNDIPIEDERLIAVQGSILHLEFLSPEVDKTDDYHVILLLVLVHHGFTKLTCYDWDSRYDLSTATARAERVAIDLDDRNPSLLIPLARCPDFLLVCDRHISTYSNLLSGLPKRKVTPILNSALQLSSLADGTKQPRWTQWERVPRNSTFSKETFYIAREDGMVLYAELNPANDVETIDAGRWPHSIDKGFACLNVDASELSLLSPDVLIAAGTASDGQSFKVGSWVSEYLHNSSDPAQFEFSFVDSISNWAPLTDLAVTTIRGENSQADRYRDTILVANGRYPHGAISELRRGINARVDFTFTGLSGCTGLWIIDRGFKKIVENSKHVTQGYITVIVSLPPQSYVMRLKRTCTRPGPWEDAEWDWEQIADVHESTKDGIVREDETIAASSLTSDLAVQISRKAARLIRRSDLSLIDSRSYESSLVAATKMGVPFVAIAVREQSEIMLQVIQILEKPAFGETASHRLPSDPTCVELLQIDGTSYVLVGLTDSSLQCFKVSEVGLVPASDGSLNDICTQSLASVCETAVYLRSGSKQMIVCGMRDGMLLSLQVDVSENGFTVLSSDITRMGTTAVHVRPSTVDPSVAFAACGPDFCRLSCSEAQPLPLTIDSIWFMNQEDTIYRQASVTAVDQVDVSEDDDRDLNSSVVAISGDRLLMSRMDYDIRWSNHNIPAPVLGRAKSLATKYSTNKTPTKLLYLPRIQKMIIATTEPREERAPPSGYRSLRSTIQLLELEESRVKQELNADAVAHKFVIDEFELKHYERVYALLEWTITADKGKSYHFILVGTGIRQRDDASSYRQNPVKETGRRLILQYRERKGLTLQKEKLYTQPARCMAFFSERQLVTVVGKTLLFEEYDRDQMKFVKIGSTELSSIGVHITVSAPFVYISTQQDSHICYEIVLDAEGPERIQFLTVFTDSRQRESLHHCTVSVNPPITPDIVTSESLLPDYQMTQELSVQSTNIALLADKACSVTGLFHRPVRTHKTATDTLFEACLPRSVIRLQRGKIRPPWRRPHGSSTTNGVLADDIIGSCSDGTVYTFTILSAPAVRLLKLVQNIIVANYDRDPANQYSIAAASGSTAKVPPGLRGNEKHTGLITTREVDPRIKERGAARPRNMHVDGDIITRYIEEEGDLGKLLREGTEQDLWHLFTELARKVVVKEGDMDIDDGGSELLASVKKWLDEILMPVL